ncbi:MAG: AAA-like domain protein [bacterium ADurb.BinA186]|nr:MAG: AAA-like domain protein [bacterium ADurb.BinA186]
MSGTAFSVFGFVSKINGSSITITVQDQSLLAHVIQHEQQTSFLSIGSLVGTRLVDTRIMLLTIESVELLSGRQEASADRPLTIIASITGTFSENTMTFSFGTDAYPMVGSKAFCLSDLVLQSVLGQTHKRSAKIGTYVYSKNIDVFYDPNVLFGKHLGVFGNTGSGKTCTIVSLIQQYTKFNPNQNIKFLILDVNHEYESAFDKSKMEFIPFSSLRINHCILSFPEHCHLFRAAQGIQVPALRDVINSFGDGPWTLKDLQSGLTNWIDNQTPNNQYNHPDVYSKNSISGFLRTLELRIDSLQSDSALSSIIDCDPREDTISYLLSSPKQIEILDMQTSPDEMDIVLFLLFKRIYQYKALKENAASPHLVLVLEEAHRYLKTGETDETIGFSYIEKIAREGRKFGIGLIISSQVPSLLDYGVVSQCNSIIMHKITNKRDMDFLRGVLRFSSDVFYQQMNSLEKQHALLCGEAFSTDALVRIENANPLPLSQDPMILEKTNGAIKTP